MTSVVAAPFFTLTDGTTLTFAGAGDRYRRGLYTFVRRTAPYPSLVNFDAPSREFCTVKRPRTNTPLQALTTLNDPAFFEAAQALAKRMTNEAGSSPSSRAVKQPGQTSSAVSVR